MSYILEALKKSETRRRLGRDPVYREAGRPPGPALLRWASLVAGLLLLLALALAVQVMVWRDPLPSPTPAVDANVAARSVGPAVPNPADADVPSVSVLPASPEMPASEWSLARPLSELAGQAHAPASPPPAAPRPAPATGAGTGRTPWLSSLPESFRKSLPPLIVNIHVYTPDKDDRILYINNRPVQSGETMAGGVVVEEIVPEGVVLRYHGQRFKLPRPS